MMIPIVLFQQLYSFNHSSFLRCYPRPEGYLENEFHATADEVLNRYLQLSDNAGATDEHRALIAWPYAMLVSTQRRSMHSRRTRHCVGWRYNPRGSRNT